MKILKMKTCRNRQDASPAARSCDRSPSRYLLAICVLMLMLSGSVFAQTTFGTITGVVRDTTGAVVPGAPITITNEDTGLTYKATSSPSGFYTETNLLPGSYSIHAVAPGFKEFVVTGVHLNANQTANVDATLQAGAGVSRIQVTSNAPVLDTQNATLSTVLVPQELEQLPLITGQKGDEGIWGYAYFNPGVSDVQGKGFTITANGARTADEAPTVDGIIVMSYMDGVGGSTVQPSIHGIGEADVILGNAAAEFAEPVELAMVRKGGTNQFHGATFYNYNGSGFNARNYFSAKVPFRVYNDFGASLGGPIRKNKLFFFGDYEGSRESTAVINTLNVPLEQWRTGDFSNLTTQLTDPFTGLPYPGNQIPSNEINPVSLKIQSAYFLPPNFGAPSLQAGNYRALLKPGVNGVTIFDRFDTRVDAKLSPKDLAYAGYSYSRMPLHAFVAGAVPPFGLRTSLRVATSGVVGWTHTFNPNLLNEARFGFARDNNQEKSPIVGSTLLSQLGITGVATQGLPTYPVFSVTGLTSAAVIPYFSGITTNFEATDTLSWVHGAHLVKLGFDVIRDRNSSFYYGNNVYGTYTFTGTFTGAPYADMLLGLPHATSITTPNPLPHWFGDWWSAYAQDQWKVSDRLSLAFGLRWDAQLPYSEKNGFIYNFNPANGYLVVPAKSRAQVSPLFPSNIPIQTAQQAGYPGTNLLDRHLAYFYPRLGFAYRPPTRANLVIRGGYGIYGLNTYGGAPGFLSGGPFSGSEAFTNKIVNGSPLFSFPQPFLPSGTIASQSCQWHQPAF